MSTPSTKEQLVAFVSERVLLRSWTAPAFLGQSSQLTVGLTRPGGEPDWFGDVEAFGAALADDVGFQAIRLGTWLNTPDGSVIAEAVGQVVPLAYRPEFQFVVDGLRFAATKQRQAGWERAVGVTCLISLLILFARSTRSA